MVKLCFLWCLCFRRAFAVNQAALKQDSADGHPPVLLLLPHWRLFNHLALFSQTIITGFLYLWRRTLSHRGCGALEVADFMFIQHRKAFRYLTLGLVCLEILCWHSCDRVLMWQLQETAAAAIHCQILEERSLGKMVAIKVIFTV